MERESACIEQAGTVLIVPADGAISEPIEPMPNFSQFNLREFSLLCDDVEH